MHKPSLAIYWALYRDKSCKYFSTHTFKSHVAESELNSQKETGFFFVFFNVRSFLHLFHKHLLLCKVHCRHDSVPSSSWDSPHTSATACWEGMHGLVCRDSKHISWYFFDMSGNVRVLHSGKKSSIPKHLRWGAPAEAASVLCPCLLKMHQTEGLHYVFVSLEHICRGNKQVDIKLAV